jgi:hypothetical protein
MVLLMVSNSIAQSSSPRHIGFNNSGEGFNITLNSAGQLEFRANSQDASGGVLRMVIDDDNGLVGIGGPVSIGTGSTTFRLHVVGGDAKIGVSSGDNRKLYFGDGSYIWIGEDSDDHFRIHVHV